MRHHVVNRNSALIGCVLVLLTSVGTPVSAQKPAASATTNATAANAGAAVVPPADYVIGPDDLLSIVFWRDKDLSADVVVRPDGKISLPLLNEIQAAGCTPEQLRVKLVEAAGKFVEEPNATVVVKEIHSRNAFITGNVAKPGTYGVTANMTVMQMIALAGGLLEFADQKKIVVIRNEGGKQRYHTFDYSAVVKGKRSEQNIVLMPGDTVIVP